MKSKYFSQGEENAWNPGIKSTLPAEYLPLSTLFRAENVFTSIETAAELSDFTGLEMQQMVQIRPQRLVVHELLIRVSADIYISDGTKYEDLGFNFRHVVAVLHQGYIEPEIPEIVKQFNHLRQQIQTQVEAILSNSLFSDSSSLSAPQPPAKSFFGSLFRSARKPKKKPPVETSQMRDHKLLAEWTEKAGSEGEPQLRAIYQALTRLGNALIIKHGRLIGDKALLADLVTGFVCNDYLSGMIGEMIAPIIRTGADNEGYRILPTQQQPVLINVKGASAAGKSTMRPLQHKHVEKLGLAWQDFALISPDIWRKYLLDYDSLGVASKYAGTLTGDEVPILDQKFDQYIKQKSKQGGLPHLLIDRFRFNSFAHGLGPEKGSNLLTRFGHTVYLVFLVTPPEATVERAWVRGLQVGRFKSVDDLLDHNIEAFKGIPKLFFTWALHKQKLVYYEFLDNSVLRGQIPRTIAFGLSGEMYILDFKCLLDIVRYTKININASNSSEVYPSDSDMQPENNTYFILECVRKIPVINFVSRDSGMIYARMESGRMKWIDTATFRCSIKQPDALAVFKVIASELITNLENIPQQPAIPIPEQAQRQTMGNLS